MDRDVDSGSKVECSGNHTNRQNGFPEPEVTRGKFIGMVEVLDPNTGALKTWVRAPEPFKFMNDSLGYALHVADDGEVSHTIYRLKFRQ